MQKPVFVRKKDRITVQERDRIEQEREELERFDKEEGQKLRKLAAREAMIEVSVHRFSHSNSFLTFWVCWLCRLFVVKTKSSPTTIRCPTTMMTKTKRANSTSGNSANSSQFCVFASRLQIVTYLVTPSCAFCFAALDYVPDQSAHVCMTVSLWTSHGPTCVHSFSRMVCLSLSETRWP